MHRSGNSRPSVAPLLRVRHLAVMSGCIAALVAGPLVTVWKQAYITQSAIRRGALVDSVAMLTKRSAQLRLSIDTLSASNRIETIARQRLGLEYPAAGKIVIVRQQTKKTPPEARGGFLAALRRSVGAGRG